jgi:hypothetical protein
VTVNIPLEDHSRIDDFLPDHDFSASYDIRVKAPASAVYEHLLSLDFGKIAGRALPDDDKNWETATPQNCIWRSSPAAARDRVRCPGGSSEPGACHGRCRAILAPRRRAIQWELTADDFTRFVRSGYAKAAWNFRVRAESPGRTVLSTETRIKCFRPGALRAF